MKISISKENYLKAIAEAEAEGETVIAATLARWLNVSTPMGRGRLSDPTMNYWSVRPGAGTPSAVCGVAVPG